MPWAEMSVVSQRYQVVQMVRSGIWTVSEAAAREGVSRKTVYKWLHRFDEGGVEALQDRPRAPHHSPSKTAPELLEPFFELRRRHGWGAAKLRKLAVERDPEPPWPSESTIHRALREEKLVSRPLRRRRHQAPLRRPTEAINTPNALWTVDFKGEFRLGNRQLCYPLTMQDYASRYLLKCHGLNGVNGRPVQQVMADLFRVRGLPEGILSDGGPPFAGQGLSRLSRLSVWWLKLDIQVYRTRPGSPQDNGRHERMHRDLKAFTARPPSNSMRAQQKRFDAFVHEFNEIRPHEAHSQEPPARHYQPATRQFPERIAAWEYPGHFELRKVDSAGKISWHDQGLRVTKALCGEVVGLEEVDDGIWALYFRDSELARLNERTRQITG